MVQASSISLDGFVISDRALKMPAHLAVNNFTGFNGWFNRFKGRHKIIYRILADESRSFDSETLDEMTGKMTLTRD
jgi:hypothetical protein